MQQELGPWSNTIEFKYFDHLYTKYWTTQTTSNNICQLAQKLLSEANKLQQDEEQHKQEILQYLPTITRRTLQAKLRKPTKVYPQRNPPSTSYRPIPSITPPRATQATSSLSRNTPVTPTRGTPRRLRMSNRNTWETAYRCFECDSPNHFKWNCPQYQCRFCKLIAPGHSQKNCPEYDDIPDDFDYGYHEAVSADGRSN